jgi:tRNA (mo5U34)-methyltransferase
MTENTENQGAATPRPTGEVWSDDVIRERIKNYRWFVHTNFGNGIVARSDSWPDQPDDSWHAGSSKFDFIVRRNLPDLQGKRILEIGCNAGVISIHMARLGAAEVVGIDCERGWSKWKEQAEFVKSALEWRCKTTYNIRYIECNMGDLPSLDLGTFDAVIALNCLYYVDKETMARVTRHAAAIAPHFLVQSNTGDHPGLRNRTNIPFLTNLLAANGFPRVTVDQPWDKPRYGFLPRRYTRPVIVGRRQ